MATDTVKVLKSRNSVATLDAISAWILGVLSPLKEASSPIEAAKKHIHSRWNEFRARIATGSTAELVASGREVMLELGNMVAACLLVFDAASDRDQVATEVAVRFVEDRLGLLGVRKDGVSTWSLDGLIAFGWGKTQKESRL